MSLHLEGLNAVGASVDVIINTAADVGSQVFYPSSSSLAGALGWEISPHSDHTSRVSHCDPYSTACVRETEVEPLGLSHTTPGEQGPIVSPAPQTFGQTAEADANESITTTEEDQDTVSFFYCPRILQLFVYIIGDSLPRETGIPADLARDLKQQ